MPYDNLGNWYPYYDYGYPYSRDRYGGYASGYPYGGMYGGGYGYNNYGYGYGGYPYATYQYTYTEDVDDDDIRDNVEDSIESDWAISRKDAEHIQVAVDNGHVTLTGEVHNRRAKHHAYLCAYWSPGVTDVENRITIQDKQRQGQSRDRDRDRDRDRNNR